jgi:hypothetical protein
MCLGFADNIMPRKENLSGIGSARSHRRSCGTAGRP